MKVKITEQVMKKLKAERIPFNALAEALDMSSINVSKCMRGEKEFAPEKLEILKKEFKIKIKDK